MNRTTPSLRWIRLLALLVGLSLVAAACGGDDGGGSAAPDRGDGGGGTPSATEPVDEGEPQSGGSLVYGLEADTSTPWTPAKSVCAISCHMVMRAVYDPMTVYNPEGEVVPYLLESIEPNEDFTAWTLTPRPGVTFHDGTPFDAAAIVANIEAHRQSFLTGKALANVSGVALSDDGAAAVITMTEPWAGFPSYLTGQIGAQVGYVASPTWLAAAAQDSTLESRPVGTGPFVFESYEPGGSFVATKNEQYWRADEGLPYLDRIEFRVIADGQARKNALVNGDIDMMHTSSGELIAELRENDDVVQWETAANGETSYWLLNNGNPDSHLSDVRVRRALAMGYDRQAIIDRRGAGIGTKANGPFGPDQIGYLEDSGFPEYDPEGAKELLQEYMDEKGIDRVPVAVTVTTDPAGLQTAELIKQYWDQVGFDIELAQIEQGQFIITALTGDFEMFGWRNHGGVDPDTQRIWWHSETADDPPGLALNFGRIKDDVIDENLDIIRRTDDPEEKREAAEAINRRFADQVYNLWGSWGLWSIASTPEVKGVRNFELPDGGQALTGISGAHPVAQLWKSE